MKKLKRLAAVLLAGVLALALLTACGGSDPGNPEFDAKVESAYLKALNEKFGKTFENDADIKTLAVRHIAEIGGADSLSSNARCKTEGDGKTVVRLVQICYDVRKSTKENFVPLFYQAAKTDAIKANYTNVLTLFKTVENELGSAEENGITLELTALGVGAKTIGGKTYVAIGFELTNAAAQ